jgi:hypothetical protein
MTRRILISLTGVLLIAALVAVRSIASGDSSPTAKPSGNGYYGNGHYAPWSRWGHGWWDRDNDGRYWNGWGDGDGYFNGHAGDGYYGGDSAYSSQARRRSGVKRVMVAVKRLRGDGQCQHMRAPGRLSRPGACSATHWVRAIGTSRWRLPIPRPLPVGLPPPPPRHRHRGQPRGGRQAAPQHSLTHRAAGVSSAAWPR